MSKSSAVTSTPADNFRIGAAQRRIVNILKKQPGSSTASLAGLLDVTSAAIRLQLSELEEEGLVEQTTYPAKGRGRPSAAWTLTEAAMALFPDRHNELTVEIIQSIKGALGEQALTQVLAERDKHLLAQLHNATPAGADFNEKLKTLVSFRSRMGYMAELENDEHFSLLIEHHCPVCAAARECQGLCRNELQLFRTYMGEGVSVERVNHLLSGDTRCAYRIQLLRPD